MQVAESNRYWFEEASTYREMIDRLCIPEEQYLGLANLVSETFPRKWVEAGLRSFEKRPIKVVGDLWPSFLCGLSCNPIPITMGSTGGYGPLVGLIRLGQLLSVAKKMPNERRKLERLQGDASEYVSAMFELEVLEAFFSAGFSLSDRPEAAGVDFTFEKLNRPLFVEVTHRGPSWIMEVASKIGQTLPEWGRWKVIARVSIDYGIAKKYVDDSGRDSGTDVLAWDIDRALGGCRSVGDRFEDTHGRFRIEVEESEEAKIVIDWTKGKEDIIACDTARLFEGRLKEKRKQLSLNDFSFCCVDLRSLIPGVCPHKSKEIGIVAPSKFTQRVISVAGDFLAEMPSVAGILIWIRRAGRVKDPLVDTLDQNEIILVNARDRLCDAEAKALFSFAQLPDDLDWYCGESRA